MAKHMIFIMTFLCALSLVAQDSIIELYRADLKTEKRAIVADVMIFTTAEEEAFWPVYRDFEYELSGINDRVISLIKEYAASHETVTDEQAASMLQEICKIKEERLKLEKSYAKKFAKVISSTKVMRFYQVHNELSMIADLQIGSNIPYVKNISGAAK